MAEFTTTPDYPIQEETIFNNDMTSAEDSNEQRRASNSATSNKRWVLRFINRSKTDFETVRDFLNDHKGADTYFTWENPIDEVTYIVRFEKDSFTFRYKARSDDIQLYDFSFSIIELDFWTTSTTSTTSTSTSTTTTSTSTTSTSTTSTTSTSTTSTTSTSTTSTTSTSTTSTSTSTTTTSTSTTSTSSTTTTT